MFEINLVPDVKAEMVKAQRARNIIGLVCGFLTALMVLFIMVLGGIKAGQDISIKNKEEQIGSLSEKLNNFSNLDSFLTIQSQLQNLDNISANRKLLSRLFSFIWVFEPTNGDRIEYSNVDIDMDTGILSFGAQAVAGLNSYDNFAALESFEKSIPMMKYDFGNYVTSSGTEIPSVCIIEVDDDGNHLKEENRLFAKWAKTTAGCDPDNNVDEEGNVKVKVSMINEADVKSAVDAGYFEKIYRTPLLNEWKKKEFLSDDGAISGVAHFESQCIKYTYFDEKWGSNNICDLVPGGMQVSNKASATNEGESVLSFNAVLSLDPQVFLAGNEHMIAIGPTGYTNVTGSYTAISELFTDKAIDCDGTNCEVIDYEEKK